ncbi:MAG: hypothetical protein RL368_201 [Pseudomonadota bacterium]|jgi:hypothetical protein
MAIDDLKKKLAEIEMEQIRQQKEVQSLAVEVIPNLVERATPKVVKTISGIYICLEFGSGAPVSEWSDETHGWRTQGLGTRYPTKENALQRLVELKQRWPDYPLKLKN